MNGTIERDPVMIVNHGSIVALYPRDDEVRRWLVDHTPEDAQWFGQALCVEPRYYQDIVNAVVEAFR